MEQAAPPTQHIQYLEHHHHQLLLAQHHQLLLVYHRDSILHLFPIYGMIGERKCRCKVRNTYNSILCLFIFLKVYQIFILMKNDTSTFDYLIFFKIPYFVAKFCISISNKYTRNGFAIKLQSLFLRHICKCLAPKYLQMRVRNIFPSPNLLWKIKL